MWGCKQHWFQRSRVFRVAIWKYYVPGQEITKTPSPEYRAIAALIQGWIAGEVKMWPDGRGFDVIEDLVIP